METNSELEAIKGIVSEIHKTIINQEKEVLIPEEAAIFLGLSLDSLNFYTTSKNPVIPFTGFGKHKRFLRTELINWLREKQTRTPWQILEAQKESDKVKAVKGK